MLTKIFDLERGGIILAMAFTNSLELTDRKLRAARNRLLE